MLSLFFVAIVVVVVIVVVFVDIVSVFIVVVIVVIVVFVLSLLLQFYHEHRGLRFYKLLFSLSLLFVMGHFANKLLK